MMTKTIKTTLLAASFLLLASCMDKGLQEDFNAVRLYSDGILTKAGEDVQATQIVAGAQVGVFAKNATTDAVLDNGSNNLHTVTAVDSKMELNTSELLLFPHSAPIDVYAYAPYVENAAIDGFTFSVNSDQSTDKNYIASDLLYAESEGNEAADGDISLTFEHKMAKVNFFLYEGSQSVTLKGATITINNVPLSVTFNPVTGGISSSTGTGSVKAATFAEDANEYVCSALFAPHTFAAGMTFLTITDIHGEYYTVSLSESKTFAAGKEYTFIINFKPVNTEIIASNITDWSEGHSLVDIGGGDINSITFMSEYAEEYAIASYKYIDANDDDYKDTKLGDADIVLNYLVRPAEIAQTLTNQDFWNDEVKVVGYYAQALTRSSFDYPMTKSFADEPFEKVIKGISATEDGILTVTLNNEGSYDFKSDFYEGLTSAKLALTVDINETDYTTKYVQVFPKDSDPNVYAQGINLNVTNLNLTMGADPFQLSATVYPSDVTVSGVTFESSNTDIVTVSDDGKVTPSASQTGNAVITVKANSEDINGFEIKREIPVEVTFVKPEIYVVGGSSVEQGVELQLRVMVYPSSYQPSNITWSSADETLATVDGSGIVTGVGYENINDDADGEPIYKTVTITANVDGYTGSIDIKATPLLPKYMIWTDGFDQKMDMKIGQTETFSADITPEDAINSADENIRWWVQAPNETTGYNKHEGNQYNFTPTMEGTYTITVKHTSSNYPHVYNMRYIDVTPYYVSSIAFNDATHTMDQGQTWTPSLTVSPSNATYKGYTLTSSNPELLVVSGTTVTANPDYEMNNATEVVTLTATSVGKAEGGSTVTATCQVTVNQVIDIIGWYYYTDGTCSETYNSGKTLAGVVFSTNDITGEDGTISSEYSGGLVVGIEEYQSDWALKGIGSYMVTTTDQSKAKGYHNTQLLKAQGATNYPIISNLVNSVLPTVTNASTWYIPSTRELNMLYDAREEVDIALSSVSNATTTFNTARKYWSSTQPQAEKADYFFWGYPSGPWKWGNQWYSGNNTTYYVRYIFAIKPVNP